MESSTVRRSSSLSFAQNRVSETDTNETDHSFSHHDCQCYYLRIGDEWTKIDYDKKAEEWMKPLERGNMTGLVEIPANWYLDDLPPMVRPFLPSFAFLSHQP